MCLCLLCELRSRVFCSFHLQWFSDNVSGVVIIRAQQIHLIYISNQACTCFLLHSFAIYPWNGIQNVPLPHNTWTWWQDICNRMLLVTIDFPTRQTQVLPFPLICFLYSWHFWKRLNKIDHFMKTIVNSQCRQQALKMDQNCIESQESTLLTSWVWTLVLYCSILSVSV